MKLKHFFWAFSTLCLLSSCGNEEEAVKNSFFQVLSQKEWNTENTDTLLSTNSIRYLQKLAKISEKENFDEARKLGFEYHRELVTMRMHGEMVLYKQMIKPEEELSVQDVLYMMHLTGTGVLGMSRQDRLRLKEVSKISGITADLQVLVATGDKAKIISTYKSIREGGKWKLDLLSSYSLEEKVLNQNYRRSRYRSGAKTAFVKNLLETSPATMEFSYRK